MTRPLRLLLGVALGCIAGDAAAQQRPDSLAPYVIRGREIDAKQRELATQVQRFHDGFAETLRNAAPELLPRLEPPPPLATGYGLLPRIVRDAAPAVASPQLQLVTYSWAWSETLLGRETAAFATLDSAARRARSAPGRVLLDSIVTAYQALLDRKKLVDADVNYNWLWQDAIARTPAPFRDATRVSDALLARQALSRSGTGAAALPDSIASLDRSIDSALALDTRRVLVPSFVHFAQNDGRWTISLPIATDIQDSAFLADLRDAIEDNWRDATHAVKLEIRVVGPEMLYCASGQSCRVPARGERIDLQAHIARFPAGVAVLTTGAGSTHVTGRALVLSAHDASRRMLAHEFGHLLGFRDNYLRGFRDEGGEGYTVTELVVDPADIMGSYKTGAVRSSHFERLMIAKDAPVIMAAGLEALYARHDASDAAQLFTRVLAIDPAHYGAHYQLAVALEQMGQVGRARQEWRTVLDMALVIGDQPTIAAARRRLSP